MILLIEVKHLNWKTDQKLINVYSYSCTLLLIWKFKLSDGACHLMVW